MEIALRNCQISFICDHKLNLSAIISGTSMEVMWWLNERSMFRTISLSGWLMENNAIKKQSKKRSRVFVYKSAISANFFLRYVIALYIMSFQNCYYYGIILFSYSSKCGWRALDGRHKTSVDAFVTLGKSWGICQNVKNWVAGGNWEVCGTPRDVWVPLWAEELPQQRARVGGKHKTEGDNVQAPHVETRARLVTSCPPFSPKEIGIHQDYFMLDFWRNF